MKKISLWATMLAMLVICGLCVTSCGKDDEEEDGGGGNNGGKKENVYSLDDYVDKYWTRCERVGANLVVEIVFENISGNNINGAQFSLANGAIRDNVGNTYYTGTGRRVVLASATDINSISNYSDKWMSLNIPAGRAVAYFIKILDFDPSNRATSISFEATFSATSGLPATSYTLDTSTLPVEDSRVKNNGIQTNDTALVYTVTNCERVGAVLQIDYTLTNNSDIDLGTLTFKCADNAIDDLGNSYYTNLSGYGDLAFGEGGYKNSCTLQLKPHETINGRVRINNFDSTNKARFVSIPLSCTSSTYTFSDNVVRFLTIPVKDNRVLYGGIQSPDLKLNVNLINAQLDDDGYLIIDYSIKNNTGDDLTNVKISDVSYILDDLSNQYSSSFMKYSVNGSEFKSEWWGGVVTNIAADETIRAAIKIETPFNKNAKNASLSLAIESSNYEFVDNYIRFITIPISK